MKKNLKENILKILCLLLLVINIVMISATVTLFSSNYWIAKVDTHKVEDAYEIVPYIYIEEGINKTTFNNVEKAVKEFPPPEGWDVIIVHCIPDEEKETVAGKTFYATKEIFIKEYLIEGVTSVNLCEGSVKENCNSKIYWTTLHEIAHAYDTERNIYSNEIFEVYDKDFVPCHSSTYFDYIYSSQKEYFCEVMASYICCPEKMFKEYPELYFTAKNIFEDIFN